MGWRIAQAVLLCDHPLLVRSSGAYRVLGTLASFADDETGACRVSVLTIAGGRRIDKRDVERHLQDLRAVGLVESVGSSPRGGRPRGRASDPDAPPNFRVVVAEVARWCSAEFNNPGPYSTWGENPGTEARVSTGRARKTSPGNPGTGPQENTTENPGITDRKPGDQGSENPGIRAQKTRGSQTENPGIADRKPGDQATRLYKEDPRIQGSKDPGDPALPVPLPARDTRVANRPPWLLSPDSFGAEWAGLGSEVREAVHRLWKRLPDLNALDGLARLHAEFGAETMAEALRRLIEDSWLTPRPSDVRRRCEEVQRAARTAKGGNQARSQAGRYQGTKALPVRQAFAEDTPERVEDRT